MSLESYNLFELLDYSTKKYCMSQKKWVPKNTDEHKDVFFYF